MERGEREDSYFSLVLCKKKEEKKRRCFTIAVKKLNRSGLTMPLSRHSVGTFQETSSHATRQVTLGHSRISSLGHCGLIFALKKSRIDVRELIST